MAFFSFSLLDDSFSFNSMRLQSNLTYYSKDITLWKELNDKKKEIQLKYVKFENRSKINIFGKKLLICLPPKFGLGDAIEYSIAINSIIQSNKFSKIGIAFCSNYNFVFKNIFSFKNIYPDLISSIEKNKYDTIFHLTLEISALKFQKYKRSDIVLEICKHFNVQISKYKIKRNETEDKSIKKISIFPVSTSVIRSMPHKVIGTINKNFEDEYNIEIIIDNSDYSNYLQEIFFKTNVVFKKPTNIENLIKEIFNVNFGVFIDSGPLHVAKLFNRPGVFIETSVSKKILLRDNDHISTVKNKYRSQYCNGPCGLTDIFSFMKNVGCYETNQLSFEDIKRLKSLKDLQRRNKKENNSHFILNPVGCIKKIDIENIIQTINYKLKEC